MNPENKHFKIMFNLRQFPDAPRSIPWRLIAPHEKQAIQNHGQTLERLNERGGLDPKELYAVMHDLPWRSTINISIYDAVEWLKSLK